MNLRYMVCWIFGEFIKCRAQPAHAQNTTRSSTMSWAIMITQSNLFSLNYKLSTLTQRLFDHATQIKMKTSSIEVGTPYRRNFKHNLPSPNLWKAAHLRKTFLDVLWTPPNHSSRKNFEFLQSQRRREESVKISPIIVRTMYMRNFSTQFTKPEFVKCSSFEENLSGCIVDPGLQIDLPEKNSEFLQRRRGESVNLLIGAAMLWAFWAIQGGWTIAAVAVYLFKELVLNFIYSSPH